VSIRQDRPQAVEYSMKNSIVVIDDEIDFLDSVRRGLITAGFKKIRTEADPEKIAAGIENGETFDIALIDITMPGMGGIELMDTIKSFSPRTECIMITAVDEARIAVECLKKGAYDYLVKPISREDLISSINRALERKRLLDILDINKRKSVPQLSNPEAFAAIVTGHDKMVRILKEAELHAVSEAPILITGETGTGKELLSRAIHAASPRSRSIFTPINMDALSSSLFDAEFFGHTKGAFTGAEKERAGYLETTHKGTLFLDEIGNLPLELQGKLLRVLQDGEYFKIGTSKPTHSDVRVIAATNKELDVLMAKNRFRRDLYYRLSGSWLHLPALRERREDIPLLIGRFISDICGPEGFDVDEEAMSILLAYDYPGNIRELKSIVQSAVNLARGKRITVGSLPPHLPKKVSRLKTDEQAPGPVPTLAELEKGHILKVYRMTDRNKAEAARVLGIGVNTLRRKLESYGET
jgi:DNA-binding NtrC family response regulator